MNARKPSNIPGIAPAIAQKAAVDEKRPPVPPLVFTDLKIETDALHPRSATMRAQLMAHQWNITPKNGQDFLDDKYLVVDGKNTDFQSFDLASIGSNPANREVIIFNPKHPSLEREFKALEEVIKKFKNELSIAATINDTDILEIALNYVRKSIRYDEKHTDKIVNASFTDKKNPPRIPFDVFLNVGVGVCRHQALFLAYLLDRLIKEKYLSPHFKVYLHRDDVPGGAHTWVMIKNELTDELFYIDPANFTVIFNLRNIAEREEPLKLLGHNSFARCIQRYSYTVLPYNKIKDENNQCDFLIALLDQKEIVRLRIFLQIQSAANSLVQIKHDLQNHLIVEVFKKRDNYKPVLTEIARIDRINNASQLDEIRGIEDIEQFIIALLIKKPAERQAILQKQNSASLAKLLMTLNSYSPTLKQVKLELPYCNNLLNEASQAFANLKLLRELCAAIRQTITDQKLVVEPASSGCCAFFSKSGKEITVGNFKRRIPREAFQYYDMLVKVNPETATAQELIAVMQKINSAAEKSASNADDPNYLFYEILKLKGHEQMMREVKDFNVHHADRRPTLVR